MRSVLAILMVLSLASVSSAGQEEESLPDDLRDLTDLMDRSLDERASAWACKPLHGKVCGKEGCDESSASVTVKLDFGTRTYSRCDAKGCDQYKMIQSSSGVFTIAAPDQPASFIKVLNDGSESMEVVTLGLSAQINFGVCKPEGP